MYAVDMFSRHTGFPLSHCLSGKLFEVTHIMMMSLVLFITVAIFKKPLRLFLEYDNPYFECHVVSNINSRDI